MSTLFKILLSVTVVVVLAGCLLALLVYRQLPVVKARLAKWRAYCEEREQTKAEGEIDKTANLVLDEWVSTSSRVHRVLVALLSFDMERRGHPRDVARSQAISGVFAWATRDRDSPALKARPEYSAKIDVLTRAIGNVLAQLRDDPEFQRSFATYLRESLDEDFDPRLLDALDAEARLGQ